jgi:DNA-dependent metalloprotease WSS1
LSKVALANVFTALCARQRAPTAMAPPRRPGMVTLDSDVFMCCRELKTLGWENDANAQTLLRRAADHVKPIMAKRKWAVPIVKEFYPTNGNLLGLNVNGGESIMVRLRRPSSKASFYDYGSILHTLLHELVHIECGPHNAAFYKLLDVLVAEAEKLPDPGTAGGAESNAFAGPGARLGDWSHRTVPLASAREAAAAAAAKRAQKQALMGSGVLGGGGGSGVIWGTVDPRVMAGLAAERRARDDVWCPRGNTSTVEGDVAGDAFLDVIDVDTDDSYDVDDVVAVGSAGNAKAPQDVIVLD